MGCIHICIYVYVCLCMGWVGICVCACVSMCTWGCACVHAGILCTYMHTHVSVPLCLHACVHLPMSARVFLCPRVWWVTCVDYLWKDS